MNFISSFITAASTLLGSLCLFVGIIRASSMLHTLLVSHVMRWPVNIFDITPIGRIINRFGYDIDVLDNKLGHNFRQLLLNVTGVC